MSWREDIRADRAAAAEERRKDQAAHAEEQRKNQAAQAGLAQAATERRRQLAAARRADIAAWLRRNRLELLFVPVILVPALLAWPAMAAYGREIFGPHGVLLPAFTEGAMWAFAVAVGVARHQQRATWSLQLGVWVCAVAAGGMNFLHGLAVGGPVAGTVMAVVSVGGVVVHQLATARPRGPRKTRAERQADQVARTAGRRIIAVRRAAVRQAVADLAQDGTATLVFRPGKVTLRRTWRGRSRLVDAIVPGLPPTPLPDVDPTVEILADEVSAYLAGQPSGNGRNAPGTAETQAAGTPEEPVSPSIAKRVPGLLARVRKAITAGKLTEQPTRTEVQKFLRCRAEVAVAVTNALYADGNGTGLAGVA
nr:hypothetical protein [Kibdelosporangium sp. MJ126-NF4]CEL15086.1 hypothetical protein [Kibdelosporangium sp. MJ126-NF4]CTQ93320.1 hypothetical protein [Kibdelosporangium sp. MJ126-NF4]